MGVASFFGLDNSQAVAPRMSAATIGILPQQSYFIESFSRASRDDAMSVPSLARARNIICGTIGSLPVRAYDKRTGQHIEGKTFLEQPDPSLPGVVTYTYTAEDILFRGHAFWQILSVWPEDGRVQNARRIDPVRVTWNTDTQTGTIINGFYVDGNPAPIAGVGSLIMFSGIDEGLLGRAGRTLNTAINLEKAAARMADEPSPTVVLKNTGVDLPSEQVTSLLSSWKSARQARSTAYVSGPIDVSTFGFDSAQMQLVEARQHTANEIARLAGIPAWYLNAETASATYSNVSAERRSLVDFSLKPIMACIEQRLSMDDITARNQIVRFDLDAYLRGNPVEQIDVVEKLLALQLIDIPEAQKMLDIVPGGNA